VVLRSQLGEYVGCKVTTDQAAVDFPAFPPLPEAPVPLQSAPARPLPPPAKLPVGPPLIIIGTKVGTNPPPDIPMPAPSAPALKAAGQPTKAPAPVVVITNIVTVTNTETNLPAAVSPPVPAKPADAIVPAQKTGLGSGGALAIGAGLLAAAAVLTVWMMRRVRESGQSSLITRSLDQKNDPPSKT